MRYGLKKFGHYARIRRDDNVGDQGGGGGSAASTPAAQPTASPSAPSGGNTSSYNAPAEPAQQRYVAEREPTEQEGNDVRAILDKETDPNHSLSYSEIQKLLGFPMKFAKPKDEPTPVPVAVNPNAPKLDAQGNPIADPNAPQQPAAPKLDPNVAALVEALKGNVQQPANPQQQPNQPQAPKPYYGGHVPAIQVEPALAQAIFNAENPQQAHEALNFLLNGFANKIMEDNGQRMLAVAKQMFTAMPKMTTAQIQQTSQTEKFFTKFAELNRPAFQPVVAQLATAMRADYQRRGVPIDDKFIDALGDATHKFLEQEMGVSFRPNKQIASAPTPGPKVQQNVQQPPPKGKFFTPGGSRAEAALPNGKAQDWQSLVI